MFYEVLASIYVGKHLGMTLLLGGVARFSVVAAGVRGEGLPAIQFGRRWRMCR